MIEMTPERVLFNRIKVLRAERDWTQEQLAEHVGVTRKTINTVERGVFIPSTVLALRLSRAFGVPVEAIFSLSDKASAEP
jgi:putative transcriptional regulator